MRGKVSFPTAWTSQTIMGDKGTGWVGGDQSAARIYWSRPVPRELLRFTETKNDVAAEEEEEGRMQKEALRASELVRVSTGYQPISTMIVIR